jgi:hypothetical protein
LRHEYRRHRKLKARAATIPQTGLRAHAGRPNTAECKAHAGINEKNIAWANLLSFITQRKEAIKDNARMSLKLTDIPTTWEEYCITKLECWTQDNNSSHQAFLHALNNDNLYFMTQDGMRRKTPRMLREDPQHELSTVLTTLAAVRYDDGDKGYMLPFHRTFDESGHAYTVSKGWTYALTLNVLAAAKEVTQDALFCEKDLLGVSDSPASKVVEDLMPHVGRISARVACTMAAALGQQLVEALDRLVLQKMAYAEMIIANKIDIEVEGEWFSLHNFDGAYFYVNYGGDKNIPF